MYIVEIKNGDIQTEIHGERAKLTSGNIVKGINTIDSFTFSVLPNNPGFNLLNNFTTRVTAYNTNSERYDFVGRVLYVETTMDESGLITKNVTCESVLGYLCDSIQEYYEMVLDMNCSVLMSILIDRHNSLVEPYKQFKIGNVAELGEDNSMGEIQRVNTWDSIKSLLIDKYGGEIQVRFEEDGMYLDYLDQIGEKKETEIALSVNMKSVTREQDPTEVVTRLIPLGGKLEYEDGESEYRIGIADANDGKDYLDDEEAIAVYGIHVGIATWDDVYSPYTLKEKGEAWLEETRKFPVKYSITALELSLIGKAFDDFDVGNYHNIKNSLIGLNDVARIIKKNIDVCDEVKSTIEVGDNLKTLSDIQRDQAAQARATTQRLESQSITLDNTINRKIELVLEQMDEQEESFTSQIRQLSDSIKMEVNGSLGSNASIILSVGVNEYTGEFDLSQIRQAFANDKTAISISAGTLTFNSNTIIINSSYFTLDSSGYVTATGGTIGGWTLKNYKLYAGDGSNIKTVAIQAPTANNLYVFAAGGTSHDSYADCPFRVTKAGKLYATDAIISGSVVTIDSPYKTELDFGSLRLYWNDDLCGTVNTKYWTGASSAGVSLRVEEGGKYIMFSHADDTQGSGYKVDYYLNAGWSSNYAEMHIFQTSARFLSDVYLDGKTDIGSLRLRGPNGKRYLVTANDNGTVTCSLL